MNRDLPHNGFHLYQVGDFQLDTKERTLLQGGEIVAITPKMYDVLTVLVQNNNRILEKEELLKKVWPDSFVEEGNLAVTIRHLRKVLGDDAHSPKYIETIARRGYRLIADVREVPVAQPVPPPEPRPYVLISIGAVLMVSLLVLAFVWFKEDRKNSSGRTATPLTSNENVTIAAVSPDGRTLVFAQKDGTGESLWTRDLLSGTENQILPPGAAEYVGLTVSPASDFIYYSVFANNAVESNFSRIPVAGGTPEPLHKIASDVSVSFSPDGLRFAYTESHGAVKETLLKVANADGTEPRIVATAKSERRVFPVFRASPVAWSGDDEIACAVQEEDETGVYYRILLIDPDDGRERYLSDHRFDFIESVVWKNDDDLAITNLAPNSPGRQIWLVSKATGQARQLKTKTLEYEWLSAAGGNLFAVERDAYSSICIADFANGLTVPNTKQILNESGYIENVDWVGDRIFYNSWATGKNEVWQINPDGTEPNQLTSNSNLTLGFTVSPVDGTIVFTGTQKAADSLFIADREGKNVRQLTHGTFDSRPRFSPDGKDVIFQHGSLILPTLWKVSTDGTMAKKQLTGYRAHVPSVSPDGKTIAYQFMDLVSGNRIWKLGLMDSSNGALLNKIDFPALVTNRHIAWRPGDNLLTVALNNGGSSGFLFLSSTGDFHQIVENVTNEKISSFVWSPDGKRLAFSANDVKSDVVALNVP